MSKKTERKNKTNLVVNWPTTPFFTLDEIFALQPDAKEITLRVRLSKEIEKCRAAEIGCRTGGQGRPKKVFAFTPVPQATLDLARSQNVQLVDQTRLQRVVLVPAANPMATKPQPVAA
jgi:hypothetical protein